MDRAGSDTTSPSARAALLGPHGAAGNLAAGALAASAVAGVVADKAVEGVQGVVGRGPHPYQSGAARGGMFNTLASWVQPEMEDAELRWVAGGGGEMREGIEWEAAQMGLDDIGTNFGSGWVQWWRLGVGEGSATTRCS